MQILILFINKNILKENKKGHLSMPCLRKFLELEILQKPLNHQLTNSILLFFR